MESELCKIAFKYKTDKCPKVKHYYTPVYHKLFKDKRETIKKVVEMGIGVPERMKHVRDGYETGASLKMWRDYFPNAKVWGVDILKSAMFKDDRIKTLQLDETKERDIKKLVKQTGSDIDIFIDDGEHAHTVQLFLAQTILPLLKDDVIYIIEDVYVPRRIVKVLEKEGYKCEVPELEKEGYREHLVIVKK